MFTSFSTQPNIQIFHNILNSKNNWHNLIKANFDKTRLINNFILLFDTVSRE